MLAVIKNLLALQERDRKLMRLREELSRIAPERETLTTKATATLSALEAARERAKHIESDRKKHELDVEALKLQIAKYSLQQLQTRKNEEYRALTHEIETCNGNISSIEDKILELMEQADVNRKDIATATQEQQEVKKLVDGKLADLAKREKELEAQEEALEAGRNDLAAKVEPPVLNRYERLLKSKGDNVVVGIQHGVCGGCHMVLQRQSVVSCQGDEVVPCPSCGRILYFAEGMDTTVVD